MTTNGIFAETITFTSKSQAYRLLMQAKGEPSDATNDALIYIAEKAAKDSLLFLGQHHGAAWLAKNKTWRIDEWMRAVRVVERNLGRPLSSFERGLVRHTMMPVFDGK